MQRLFRQVMYTAEFLETESGGILVSIDKLKEGHAIIIYRGKNYRRPSGKLAKNLLTKRKALARSLGMQRVGVSDSFLLHPPFSYFSVEIHIHFLYMYFPSNKFIPLKSDLISVASVTEVFCLSKTADNL